MSAQTYDKEVVDGLYKRIEELEAKPSAYKIKESILNVLHAEIGICSCCGEIGNEHGGNTHLPCSIPLDVLIRAIDLNNVAILDKG